jgi:hypothetical protein
MQILAVFDVFGLVVLFITLLVIGAMQAAAALGIMFGMPRLTPEKLTEKTYGDFDFDNVQKPAFVNLLTRLAVVFIGATFVLHMADYFLIGTLIRDPKYRILILLALFLLESGAIAAALYFVFQLDRFRWIVLTAGSAFFYIFCLWYLVRGTGYLC